MPQPCPAASREKWSQGCLSPGSGGRVEGFWSLICSDGTQEPCLQQPSTWSELAVKEKGQILEEGPGGERHRCTGKVTCRCHQTAGHLRDGPSPSEGHVARGDCALAPKTPVCSLSRGEGTGFGAFCCGVIAHPPGPLRSHLGASGSVLVLTSPSRNPVTLCSQNL